MDALFNFLSGELNFVNDVHAFLKQYFQIIRIITLDFNELNKKQKP